MSNVSSISAVSVNLENVIQQLEKAIDCVVHTEVNLSMLEDLISIHSRLRSDLRSANAVKHDVDAMLEKLISKQD